MPNDLLKVSEEYAENTIRVAKGMKENSKDGYALDYDSIIEVCEAGYINHTACSRYQGTDAVCKRKVFHIWTDMREKRK